MDVKKIAIVAVVAVLVIGFAVSGGRSGESASTSTQASSTQAGQAAQQADASKALADAAGSGSRFLEEVHGDKTGNLRCFVYSSAVQPQELAAGYLAVHTADESEVHVLENLGLKVSGGVTVGGGKAYVDVREYVDGEENDAEKMLTGELLGQYEVDLATGEVTAL